MAQDLLNTLIASKDGCVGMEANVIGVRTRIVAKLEEILPPCERLK